MAHSQRCLTLLLLMLAVAWLVTSTEARAQSAMMAYQGYLTDSDGTPLDGAVSLSFALYSAASGGTAVWEETQDDVALTDGVFSVRLGSEAVLDGISFGEPLYLGVRVDGGDELAPRVRLTASPSSFFAHDVAEGVAVRSINGLADDVAIRAGDNVTIDGSDGSLTIAADVGVSGINGLAGDVDLLAGENVSIAAGDGRLTIGADVGVRSLNGLADDVVLQAGDNVTLSETGGTITIGAEAGEAFALPFEATHVGASAALKITSTQNAAIVATSEGITQALLASTTGSNDAAAFSNVLSTSTSGALSANSFSIGYTGKFSHFGTQGSAGIFETFRAENNDPALIAGKSALEINSAEFFNDALVVRGDAPVLGIYGKFEQNTRPGFVLAGVNDDGSVVDKWGIVRQFFAGNGLEFTYGINADPAQNTKVMVLSHPAGSNPNLSVPEGTISANQIRATEPLGDTQTPRPGGVYADNVIYAWAHVDADGSVVDSYGCTVSKFGFGDYDVVFSRPLPEGVSAVVTAKTVNDPILATAVVSATKADVAIKSFDPSIPAFVFADNGFYIQVVGRP